MGMTTPSIWLVDQAELEAQLVNWGFARYYAGSILRWLWERGITDPQVYTDLPLTLRHLIREAFSWETPVLVHRSESQDGTQKFLWRLADGAHIETVWIPQGQRYTLCISSQVGCSLNCRFCATGQLGLKRQLAAQEILLQLYAVRWQLGLPVTNVVFMGMGEPLLNYSAVMGAFERMVRFMKMSPRRFTFSTVGIPKGILRLAERKEPFELALSLHSAIESKRQALIPLAAHIPLAELRAAIAQYCEKRREWVTLEYVLLEGVNDGCEDAEALRAFVAPPVYAKVNIIVYNPVPGLSFRPSSRLEAFRKQLLQDRLLATVRRSRGQDIAAACGQLAALPHKA